MEQMLWDAACSIRGEKDAARFKDYLLPLLFLNASRTYSTTKSRAWPKTTATA